MYHCSYLPTEAKASVRRLCFGFRGETKFLTLVKPRSVTLPETNIHSPWKLVLGRCRPFLFLDLQDVQVLDKLQRVFRMLDVQVPVFFEHFCFFERRKPGTVGSRNLPLWYVICAIPSVEVSAPTDKKSHSFWKKKWERLKGSQIRNVWSSWICNYFGFWPKKNRDPRLTCLPLWEGAFWGIWWDLGMTRSLLPWGCVLFGSSWDFCANFKKDGLQ